MKKYKKYLIIPFVALFFGLLPQINVYASDVYDPWQGSDSWEVEIAQGYNYGYYFSYKFADETYHEYYFTKSPCKWYSPVNTSGTHYTQVTLNFIDKVNYNSEVYATSVRVDSSGKKTFNSSVYNVSSPNYLNGNISNVSISTSFLGVLYEGEYPSEDNRPEEIPSEGNGIFISSPFNNSKINKLKKNEKGYLEQIFTLKVQYKPDFSGFFPSSSEKDKSTIINGLTCEMNDSEFDYHVFSEGFKWIVTPETAKDSVSKPYALAEIKISTVFKDLGKKTFTVNSSLDVLSSSDDFATYEIRNYSDSIDIEFVSDESYGDGVVINPDGSIGSDGSDSDIDIGIDGFPNAPGEGASIIDWIKYFGEVIMWLVTYPFKLLAQTFTVLVGYITTMIDLLTETSKGITGLFSFIPQDILNVTYGVISFTLLYSVLRGVLKLIRGN